MVTVRRLPGGEHPFEFVSVGPYSFNLSGSGPWEMTETEWLALQGTAAGCTFTAGPAKPEGDDDNG